MPRWPDSPDARFSRQTRCRRVAYATEEILRVLILVGVGVLNTATPIAFVIATILAVQINRVEMTLGFVVVLMLGNLRGIRESGRIFALPTYFFVVSLLGLIAVGAWRALSGTIQPVEAATAIEPAGQTLRCSCC